MKTRGGEGSYFWLLACLPGTCSLHEDAGFLLCFFVPSLVNENGCTKEDKFGLGMILSPCSSNNGGSK